MRLTWRTVSKKATSGSTPTEYDYDRKRLDLLMRLYCGAVVAFLWIVDAAPAEPPEARLIHGYGRWPYLLPRRR